MERSGRERVRVGGPGVEDAGERESRWQEKEGSVRAVQCRGARD
jgi:hypothetical protein